ncbi:MAG: penicillin-binding protein 2 [Dehalococcoidia bacterium]
MPERMARVSWRLLLLGAIFCALSVFVVGRLAQLQILSHGHYAAEAENEHQGTDTVLPPRGAILDRDGYPLALTLDTYDIYISRQVWQDKQVAANGTQALASVLGKTPEDIQSALGSDTEGDALIAAGVSYDVGKKIIDMGLPGVKATAGIQRFHPEGDLASALLGFVGKDETGLSGLEADLQDELGGQPGTVYYERDSMGNPIPFGYTQITKSEPASDVRLTIDRFIQQAAEQSLDEAIQTNDASGGTIIVMDPKTGAIMAMASRPSFKLSQLDLSNDSQEDLYRDRAVTDLYEPGSVMKLVTMSAAVDLGLVTPDTTYDDTGTAYVGGYAIQNWDFSVNGTTTMTQVLQKSLNTGAVWVSQLLGPDNFYQYIKRFGFGEPTGVGLSGEAAGQVRDSESPDWTPSDLATNSFGQGINVTPLQMITAVAAIANGGMLMKPYIVQQVVGPNGTKTTQPQPVRQAISEQTASTLTTMMNAVVEGVPGNLARIQGYHVAGKTGTAYISVPGGYAPDRVITSFIGFAPVSDPRMIVLVKIDEPQEAQLGGTVAAPVFAELAPKILSYLGVPPDADASVQGQ